MKILITGATGLIGKELGKELIRQGHDIVVISRNAEKALQNLPYPAQVIEGDLGQGVIKHELLNQVHAVFHLAGESVAGGRWSEERKKEIFDSRVVGTKNLIESLGKQAEVLISSSAIGIYGDSKDIELDENSMQGSDFLAQVCVEWEKAASEFKKRTVILRTGVVLSEHGGALEKMLLPFKAGVGGAIAGGKQWMSWIHVQDLVKLYVWALNNSKASGVYNAVSPEPVTNADFSKALAKALSRPAALPVPKFSLQLLYGEMSKVILASQKVFPKKALSEGFVFEHVIVEKVLNDFFESFRQGEEIMYAEQFLPLPPEKVFPFFSAAKNLEKITPESLNFNIVGMSTAEIEQGTIIDYKLKIHGVPAKWKTKIDEWQPPFKFVDNQESGPYSLWHHTHTFHAFAGGTLMVDRVRYRLPMGYLGWAAAGVFVRKDVESIFKYRREYIFKNINQIE